MEGFYAKELSHLFYLLNVMRKKFDQPTPYDIFCAPHHLNVSPEERLFESCLF